MEKGKSSLLLTHVVKKCREKNLENLEICHYSNGNKSFSFEVSLFWSKLSEAWFCRSDLSWCKQGSNYVFEIWQVVYL